MDDFFEHDGSKEFVLSYASERAREIKSPADAAEFVMHLTLMAEGAGFSIHGRKKDEVPMEFSLEARLAALVELVKFYETGSKMGGELKVAAEAAILLNSKKLFDEFPDKRDMITDAALRAFSEFKADHPFARKFRKIVVGQLETISAEMRKLPSPQEIRAKNQVFSRFAKNIAAPFVSVCRHIGKAAL